MNRSHGQGTMHRSTNRHHLTAALAADGVAGGGEGVSGAVEVGGVDEEVVGVAVQALYH